MGGVENRSTEITFSCEAFHFLVSQNTSLYHIANPDINLNTCKIVLYSKAGGPNGRLIGSTETAHGSNPFCAFVG